MWYKIPPRTILDFILSFFCKPPNEKYFLFNACIFGTCDMRDNLALLNEYLHEISLTTFGQ